MREYETVYVLKPDLPQDSIKSLQDKITEIIKKQAGHILIHTDWGKRKLAYRVEKFRQAQYFYLQYLDAGASVAELERILKYDDKVLKFLSVKLQEKVDVQARLAAAPATPPPPEELAETAPYEGRERYAGDSRRYEKRGEEGNAMMNDDREIPDLDL